MSASGEPVTLHIYDLSRGMAKMLSPSLLGKQIDGIWHTAVVAFGREIFFGGGGICDCAPTATPYGPPNHVYDLGTTFVPRELFIDFLRGLSPRYTGAAYDLFENNCNTFSNELSIFLTGNHIPAHITGLPSEVLATPFGAMIKNYLSQQQQQMQQRHTSSTLLEDDWQAIDFLPDHAPDYQAYPRPASDSGPTPTTTEQQTASSAPAPPPRARRYDVTAPASDELLQLLTAANIEEEVFRQAVVQATTASSESQPLPPELFVLLNRLATQLAGSEWSSSWRLLNRLVTVLVGNNAVFNATLTGSTDEPGFLLTTFARASDSTIASPEEVLGCLQLATNLFAFPHGVVFATSPSILPRLLNLALAQLDDVGQHDRILASAHLVFNLLLHGRQVLDPDQVLQVVVAFAHSITGGERIASNPEPILYACVEVLVSALSVMPDAAEVLQVTGFEVDGLRGCSSRLDELLQSLAAYFI